LFCAKKCSTIIAQKSIKTMPVAAPIKQPKQKPEPQQAPKPKSKPKK
jgi:hypothetical protein